MFYNLPYIGNVSSHAQKKIDYIIITRYCKNEYEIIYQLYNKENPGQLL